MTSCVVMKRHFQKLPRLHGCMMWKLLGFTLCLFLSSQFVFGSVWAAAAEPDDVKIEVVFKPEECAQRSKRGDLINAHYDGFLAKDGSQFYCSFVAPETSRNYFLEEVEASRTLTREVTTEWVNVYALYCCRSDKAGHPQWFVLGVGQVIKGLDVGMIDMCAGEKRKVTIPSALAFGEKGKGPVPPNATVVFEVEVLSVSRGPRSMEAFGQVDLDRDKMLTKAEVKEYLKLEYEKDGKPRDDPFYEKIINDIFRKSDSDRDGLISAKEYNIYEHDEL